MWEFVIWIVCLYMKQLRTQNPYLSNKKNYIWLEKTPGMTKHLHKNICEEKLFSSLFMKYSKSLHDFLYYKYGENIHPNDKVQEAFIKLWDHCKKIPLDKAKSFLFTVANNMALKKYPAGSKWMLWYPPMTWGKNHPRPITPNQNGNSKYLFLSDKR